MQLTFFHQQSKSGVRHKEKELKKENLKTNPKFSTHILTRKIVKILSNQFRPIFEDDN